MFGMAMRIYPKGMVLISVLIFLQLITFFIVYGLQLTTLEIKQTHQDLQRLQLDTVKWLILKKVEQQATYSRRLCLIPVMPNKTLLTKPLEWWQSFPTCGGNFNNFTYYFVVEDLGKDDCAIIDAQSQRVANFFRITVLIVNDIKLKTQSIWIDPIDSNVSLCKEMPHTVVIGRQHKYEIN